MNMVKPDNSFWSKRVNRLRFCASWMGWWLAPQWGWWRAQRPDNYVQSFYVWIWRWQLHWSWPGRPMTAEELQEAWTRLWKACTRDDTQ